MNALELFMILSIRWRRRTLQVFYLLVDFETAFDTIEWPFIENALEFYGCGPVHSSFISTL
jgi:hypothetical protein